MTKIIILFVLVCAAIALWEQALALFVVIFALIGLESVTRWRE